MLNHKNILYAIDLGKGLDDSFAKLIDEANDNNVNIHIYHVVKSTAAAYGYATAYIPSDAMMELETKLKDNAQSKLNQLLETSQFNHGSVCIDISDSPKEEIIEKAKELNVDAIYINGHNHNIIGRLGSVADYVINHAKCDVVVLKH
ncbi:universal stress protein [Thiotrichales bacterium 19S3-7]|nr:universal stress protein [Thiotrichales bacterium 19S3-7]MCF6802044.1 universal stress protein [Thiotrichales bacterium 19S3-11]